MRRPIALTRLGLIAEQVLRAFWPLWTVLCLVMAPLLFGWHDNLTIEAFWSLATLSILAIVVTAGWGVYKMRWPSRDEAVARVDAQMAGRPIAAIADQQAIGTGDSASEAVWQVHMARMAERTKAATVAEPNLRIADRDPYGLRFMAMLFLLCGLLSGSILRVASVGDMATATGTDLATGPVWEGWITPPAYTGKPTLYLNDVPQGSVPVPEGSEVALRLYGEVGALTVADTVSGRTDGLGSASDVQQEFVVTQTGRLEIMGENAAAWTFDVIPDAAPTVEVIGDLEVAALGEFTQHFAAKDDYGVSSGFATITLDLDEVERRYGLSVVPEERDALVVDLPMPFGGDRDDFDELLIDDFSQHHFANLPVTMILTVEDDIGQQGVSEPEELVLPGRRFFQPFARAIIEQRRDLMWSKENGKRVVRILKAIAHRPEGLFSNEVTFLRMRAITRNLDRYVTDGLTDTQRNEIVEAMWDLAIQLEDGTLADARERLRRAQERLSEAMRNGASDEEIAELMNELREATDDYLDLLAQQMEPGGEQTDQPDQGGEGTEFTQNQLDAIMDRIQELMEDGRMAEAESLMEEYNRLLENLRMTENQSGQNGDGRQTPGQQSMDELSDTLRDQEELSDDAFRELQEQSRRQQQGQQQGQQGQQGAQGQMQPGQQNGQRGVSQEGEVGDQSGEHSQNGQGEGSNGSDQRGSSGDGDEQSLAERQEALRNELQRQRENLPGLPGEQGEMARRSLDQAEGAMDGAEEALRDGDLADAINRQAEALNALRNALQSILGALAENEQDQEGQGTANGEGAPSSEPARRDPLGRQVGNTGQLGTDQSLLGDRDIRRRADELFGEIRRRSGDLTRPEVERNYLKRLLDRF